MQGLYYFCNTTIAISDLTGTPLPLCAQQAQRTVHSLHCHWSLQSSCKTVLVFWGCWKRIPYTEQPIKNTHVFLKVLDAEKSKIRAPGDLGLVQVYFLVHRWPCFPCDPTWQKWGGSPLGPMLYRLYLDDLITSQRFHLQIPSGV